MQMVYNSDNYVVVQFDLPQSEDTDLGDDALSRGGFEIVDKFARKEIFIEGAMAETFKDEVTALIETSPSEEEMDAYIERYTSLMLHPVVLH
ncbi:BTH_I0359 family protein [Rhizobacter sp. LjRoot28]|jgi:hypothetical protein|uniref:BTH_I0359 family protein n=1 Tax=Rhizobacter sp. LjRoot28 TaxID=3342309 RepID=UPI003ECDF31C